MKKILKLNEISPVANSIFTDYEYSKDIENPCGIMLRSFKMHDYVMPESLLAVARAGAGTNNIPIEVCSEKGIVVFNTPGANANAVKELTICALLMSSRKVCQSYVWAEGQKEVGADVPKLVEKEKARFGGPEIAGKTLGVIGLGAIGAMVANACCDLGMEVLGYDPYISVESAWGLSKQVTHVTDFNELISKCDYISIHVPLVSGTKECINSESINRMKNGVRIINCSRGELVDNTAIVEACESGKVACYVTDFPCAEVIGYENIITIPHLGASTPEAEDNCAVLAGKQLTDYLENGNIKNSVNFPAVSMARSGDVRISIVHKNVKNTLSKLTSIISELGLNIANMANASKGDFAYSLFDIDGDLAGSDIEKFEEVEGVIKARILR
ncbi:MAG: phosphoglycerate dehydrogenase [Bacillota bacterium]